MPIYRTPYFSPLNVSGCVLWFDAEDTKTMTFSGSSVTSWTSKGSSTVSTSVVSGNTNPTYTTYNNLPALEFNGTSTYIQTANVSVPGTGTTWITCSVNLTPVTASTPVDSSVVLATNAPGERAIRYSATGANTYYTINRNLTNTADLLRGQINENANGIRGFMDTASYFTGFTNGTQTVSNTNAVTYVAPENQPFLMGKWASGYLNGYIYESLVYNRVLTLEEYQQVEGYLAQKWGFTASLPANHPFLRILLYRWKVPLTRLPYYKIFNPQTISSLVLWLDGRDPAGTGAAPSVGATVSTWIDKSTSAKNATAGGTPTYVSGGGINFNGSSWFSNTSFAQNLSQRSIFIIMQETTRPGTTGVFPLIPDPSSGLDYATTNGLTIETTNGLRFYGNSGGYQSDMGNSSLLVKAIYNDNMNVRAGSGFLNGSAATTVTATYTAGTCSGYGIGSRWNGASGISASGALNGVIFEIMYFNSPLGVSDRQNIEGYLAQKWGLTGSLVAGHPSLTVPVGAPATGVGKQTISFFPRAATSSPITSTVLNTIATYLRDYMSEFRNPSFFGYKLDGNSYFITDGGNDMYDGGNYTYPWLIAGTQFTGATGATQQAFSINYASTTATTVDTDFVYVSLGYTQSSVIEILSIHPLTVLGFRTSTGTPVGFQLAGNSGADSAGTLSSGILYAGDIIQGFTVHAFYRETYNATDPSHCNLFILLGHPSWGSVFGTISSFADPVGNGGNGCYFYTSGAGVSNILAIQTLLSKASGVLVTAAECQTVVQAFVNRVKLAVGF